MTKAKVSAQSSELATADKAAITVQATQPASITVDISTQWEAFTARPAVAAAGNALSKVSDGIVLVYTHEKEFTTGQNFFRFLFDAFKAILGPLLVLLWTVLNTAYVWTRKPETKTAAAAKWQAVKTWAAPSLDDATEVDRDSAIEI